MQASEWKTTAYERSAEAVHSFILSMQKARHARKVAFRFINKGTACSLRIVKKLQRFFRRKMFTDIRNKRKIGLQWDAKLQELIKQYNKRPNMLWKLKNINQFAKEKSISAYYKEVKEEYKKELMNWLKERRQKSKPAEPMASLKVVNRCLLTAPNEEPWRHFRRASDAPQPASLKQFLPPKLKEQKSQLSYAEVKRLEIRSLMKAPVFEYMPSQRKLTSMIFNTATVKY